MQYRAIAAIFLLTALVLLSAPAEATFRKPPFNGSIFGKRGSSNSEVDAAGQALSSLCTVATEACASWFAGEN